MDSDDVNKWGFVYFGYSNCKGKAFVFLQFDGKTP